MSTGILRLKDSEYFFGASGFQVGKMGVPDVLVLVHVKMRDSREKKNICTPSDLDVTHSTAR
jgi:hypothetical protein